MSGHRSATRARRGRHAQIRSTANGTYVHTDLVGTTNGTRLNGPGRSRRAELAEGDRITDRCGRRCWEFRGRLGDGAVRRSCRVEVRPCSRSCSCSCGARLRWAVRGLTVEPVSPSGSEGAQERRRPSPGSDRLPPSAPTSWHPPEGKARHRPRFGPEHDDRHAAPECELVDSTTPHGPPRSNARAIFGKNGTSVRRRSWVSTTAGQRTVNDQKLAAPRWCSRANKIRVGTTVLELRR
jgi:hypothetical protein